MINRKRGPRPKYRHLMARIRELLDTEATYEEIAKEVGVSKSTIWRICNEVKNEK